VNWLDLENPQAGGAEIHFFEIFKRLVQAGDQVTLVCSGWDGAEARTVIDGIEVQRIGGRHTFAALGRRAVRGALDRAPYDIVVEDVNKLPLYVPMLTSLPMYTIVPHLFGRTAFQEASLPVAMLVWLAERPIPWVYRRSAFHAISESTRDELAQRGVDPAAIRVVYPGVDTEWFVPDAAAGRAEVPTFLYVGRLKRYKGIAMALRALKGVRVRFPEAVLQIAGEGNDRHRLQRIAERLALSDAVRFLGFVSEVQKRELLRRAWAHVFPSVKEGWGISNVEASACGTPTIAADSPGLRESVIHEETGLLVPYGDHQALAAAMIRVADDVAFRERLGSGGRNFALGLSWERAAQQTRAHVMETAGVS
jgi:glycosyltransferase involved in cell wall biosynthesis